MQKRCRKSKELLNLKYSYLFFNDVFTAELSLLQKILDSSQDNHLCNETELTWLRHKHLKKDKRKKIRYTQTNSSLINGLVYWQQQWQKKTVNQKSVTKVQI